MIITMANTKGGSGKTTVMRALAGHAVHLGFRVTILDCDSSENATRWMDYSKEAGIWPDLLDVIPVNGASELIDIASSYASLDNHITFIDLEGTTNDFLGAGLWLADLVICPVQLAGDEIFAAHALHGPVMKQVKTSREQLPPIIVVVTNIDMIDARSHAIQEFWQLLENAGMRVAEQKLVHRKIYKSLHLGGTLYTVPNPNLKAIDDVRLLYDEIMPAQLRERLSPVALSVAKENR